MHDSITEIRTAPALALKLASPDLQAGEIVGYASLFGGEPDSYGDLIATGAFSKSLADLRQRGEMPVMLWAHDRSAPIGRWISVSEDARGLRVRGQLNLETAKGREIHSHLKAGDVNGLSIGFRTPPETVQYHKNGTQTLTEIDLREISIVTLPANRNTRITGVKSLGSVRELEGLLHEAGLSRTAAAKAASAGWAALNPASETEQTLDFSNLVARVKAASAELRKKA